MKWKDNEPAVQVHRQNAAVLMQALALRGVKQVVVTYAGSKGAGAVLDLVLTPADVLPALAVTPVKQLCLAEHVHERAGQPLVEHTQPLDASLRAFALNWVALYHPRWCDDDGGSGRMLIDVARQTLTLDHDAHYTENFHYELSG